MNGANKKRKEETWLVTTMCSGFFISMCSTPYVVQYLDHFAEYIQPRHARDNRPTQEPEAIGYHDPRSGPSQSKTPLFTIKSSFF